MKQRLLPLVITQHVLCALALALSVGVAHADMNFMSLGWNTMYTDTWASNQLWWKQRQPSAERSGSYSSPQAQASPHSAPRGASAVALSTGQTFATKKGISQLVAPVPAENQPEAAKMFTTLILTFEKTIPRTYGIPANNLASAYAAVLAGSYAAYTNRPFPENAVKPLFEQVQQGMLDNPQISRVSVDKKAAMYQVWVGAGMYLLGWQAQLAKHPNPEEQAKMQKAGADSLRAALAGTDPSRVRFTTRGMEVH